MNSGRSNTPLQVLGFPIRTSTDRQLVGTSPWLFAASHVLHRQQTPRHSPLALHNLNISHKDARARNKILKGRVGHIATLGSQDRSPAFPHNGIENADGDCSLSSTSASTRCPYTRRSSFGYETSGYGLLRKEVIQPHLPVRLPCYDFTPITDPTFGSFLPCGLDH